MEMGKCIPILHPAIPLSESMDRRLRPEILRPRLATGLPLSDANRYWAKLPTTS